MTTIFRRILNTSFLVLIASCSPTYNEYVTEDCPMSGNLTRSFLSVMQTTTNPLGSFIGNQIPNLQIDQLEPGEYTIQFQVVEAPIDPEDFGLYAYIQWKVDGQQIQRIVSVFSGAVITGVANAVDVYLLDQSGRGVASNVLPSASVINGNPVVTYATPITIGQGQTIVFTSAVPQQTYQIEMPVTNSTIVTLSQPYQGLTDISASSYSIASYKVGANLSRGSRPTIMQPPTLITDSIISIATGQPAITVVIPQDAGIISVLVTVTADSTPQTESLDGRINFVDKIGAYVVGTYVPNYFSGWFPIPVGAASMVLFNDSASANLTFGIQWGIEG